MSLNEILPNANANIIPNCSNETNENELNADKQSHASIFSVNKTRDSPTTSILATKNPKLKTRQESEESRTRSHRSLHPAIRHKQQMFILPNENTKKSNYKKGPHALNTLRRLSRADFSSVRRAGKFKQNKDINSKFRTSNEKHSL